MDNHIRQWLEAYDSELQRQRGEEEMDGRNLYKDSDSIWLKSADLKRDNGSFATLRVKISEAGEDETPSGKKQIVLKFHGKKKQLGLNFTNWNVMQSMYSWETDEWIDREITLYVDPSVTNPQTGEKGGIRIRYEDMSAPGPDVDF